MNYIERMEQLKGFNFAIKSQPIKEFNMKGNI